MIPVESILVTRQPRGYTTRLIGTARVRDR